MFRVMGGKLELHSTRIVCRLHEEDRILTCTVERPVLRDMGAYHGLRVSDEALFSRLLPEIERLANECIRANRLDESGNVTIGTAELIRYGMGSPRIDAAE